MRTSASTIPLSIILLSSVCLVFIVLYGSFASIFFSEGTYNRIPADLEEKNTEILRYVASPFFSQTSLNLPPKEMNHMEDVRVLVNVAFLLAIVCIGVLVGTLISFWKSSRDEFLARTTWISGWAILIGGFVTGMAIILDFNKFWTLFHVFLFPQGGWYFPMDSILMQLYPPNFWERTAHRWALQVVVAGVLLTCLGWLFQTTRYHQILFSQKAQKPKKHTKKK